MKTNEFLLIRDNIPVKCSALSVLYSEDSNRGFVAYFDGTFSSGKPVLKFGEIKTENDDIIIENLSDEEELKEVYKQFIDIYKKAIIELESE